MPIASDQQSPNKLRGCFEPTMLPCGWKLPPISPLQDRKSTRNVAFASSSSKCLAISSCKCLWTLETFPWVAQGLCVSPVFVLLAGIGSQSSVQKSQLFISTHLNCTKKWSEVGHVYCKKKLETFKKRFLGAKTKNAFQSWLKGTFWEEYLWNCTLSNVCM